MIPVGCCAPRGLIDAAAHKTAPASKGKRRWANTIENALQRGVSCALSLPQAQREGIHCTVSDYPPKWVECQPACARIIGLPLLCYPINSSGFSDLGHAFAHDSGHRRSDRSVTSKLVTLLLLGRILSGKVRHTAIGRACAAITNEKLTSPSCAH